MLRPEVSTARKLRKEMPLPEVLLWQRLRGAKSGLKFRHQHPVGPYIADLYCSEARLVVEIDGEIHADPARLERDDYRTAFLQENGYRVIRLNAADILKSADEAAAAIAASASRPLHHPSDGPPPRAGEDFQ